MQYTQKPYTSRPCVSYIAQGRTLGQSYSSAYTFTNLTKCKMLAATPAGCSWTEEEHLVWERMKIRPFTEGEMSASVVSETCAYHLKENYISALDEQRHGQFDT